MICRNTHDNLIHTLTKISAHYQDNPTIVKICEEVTEFRNHFDIKTIFIGHFNAGKSSLINAILGKEEFLAEAQMPQTAICAELKYGESECITARAIDGTIEPYHPSRTYSPTEYQGLHYTLPSDVLKALDGYALVDTPGFDSFIESHELALSHYMMHGSVYLFVIDIEKGGIDTTTLTKIRTIYRRCPHIAVLLNKCDKTTQSLKEQVIAHTTALLNTYGIQCPVLGVSKHDPNISEVLCSLIGSFSAQEIFDAQLLQLIRDAAQRLYVILSTTLENVSLDTFSYDEQAYTLNKKRADLLKALERKEKSLKKQAPQKTEEILDTVHANLLSCSRQVGSCLLMGSNQGAQAVIAESVRRTLSDAMAELSERVYIDISGCLDFTGIKAASENADSLTSTLESAGNKLSQMYESGTFSIQAPEKGKSKLDSGLYKAITGGAALFASVNPLIEAVVIFLPEILQFCKKLFGESDQSRVERQYNEAIIPQVINTIAQPVENCIQNTISSLLEQAKNWIGEQIESLDQAIAVASEKKAASEQEYQSHVSLLNENCQSLAEVLNKS